VVNKFPRFWERLHIHGDNIALIHARSGATFTYRQLADLTADASQYFSRLPKLLVCLCGDDDVETILCYLTLLLCGHTVYLCGPNVSLTISQEFIDRYRPAVVFWRSSDEYGVLGQAEFVMGKSLFGHQTAWRTDYIHEIYPELALLLSTSGSTGNAKLVRLSYRNLAANAWQIAQALDIQQEERALLSLPLHYSYGLSVLNSFLGVGASVVIGKRSVMDPAFWHVCEATQITTLPLVPTMLKFMESIAADKLKLPALRKITTSGAAMEAGTREWVVSRLQADRRFYSMYGMTEATARVAVLAPEEFCRHPTSVGRAMPNTTVDVLSSGEIRVQGPNVMLGYADSCSALARGDDLLGSLNTGDLGVTDSAGNLYITGRLARFSKLFGLRVDLADVENQLIESGDVAVVSDDSVIIIFHTAFHQEGIAKRANRLADRMRIPRAAFVLQRVHEIPRTESGKTRYAALWSLFRGT
jgi:acyl-CoA synthetase (AMP-forming)/AMP-acid ligase II